MEFVVNFNIYPLTVYSLVASETTGNDFLIERHFSLSMNSELDLTLRSCSSLALFRSKSWKIGKIFVCANIILQFLPGEQNLPR